MNKDDHVCVCHRVSLGKIVAFIKREEPKVASQLSECLGAGTGCGWCIPFLEKLHKQYQAGNQMTIGVDTDRYVARRGAYNDRRSKQQQSDE